MKDIENYNKLYKSLFAEECKLENIYSNNCIGALNSMGSSNETFTYNFIERLKRLIQYFEKKRIPLKQLKKTFKDIGTETGYKWSGPYSELVALDYWIQFDNLRNLTFINDFKTKEFCDSISKRIGKETIDIDISLDLQSKKIYMDVKSFIPTHLEFIDHITDKVKQKLNLINKTQDESHDQKFSIGIEDINGGNYYKVSNHFRDKHLKESLIEGLVQTIQNKKLIYEHVVEMEYSYKFRIAYPDAKGTISLATVNEMDPYESAKNNVHKFLGYYNKLLINEPSLLLFVINPWFNKESNTFLNFNSIFYRAICRRLFIQLGNDDTKATYYLPNIENESITVADIVQKITGVIFLEDNSILEESGLFNSYIYLNPNATNYKLQSHHFNILSWTPKAIQPEIIEDFFYDNY